MILKVIMIFRVAFGVIFIALVELISKIICDGLHDLVPILQFKKREKHPRRSVDVSKVAGFKPVTLLK